MAIVIFYEKPDCINNKRQKKLLQKSGHTVTALSLLEEAWTADRLEYFLKDVPRSKWFNKSAPDIKSGRIKPEQLNAQQSLKVMVENPLLIARPLMQVSNEYMSGFDLETVHNWIGLNVSDFNLDLETCLKQ